MRRTGLPEERIILVGHSMGGRAILRLLYDYHRPEADTTVSPRNIRQAILLSPEVNYIHSAQASLFAGTNDEAQEPWASFTGEDVAGTDLWLLGSTADDVVSDECLLALYARLGAADVPDAGVYSSTQTNAWGSSLTIRVMPGVLHSYQMYSPQFVSEAQEAVSSITGSAKTGSYPAWEQLLTYAGWGLALLGAALFLRSLTASGGTSDETPLPVLTDPRRFLRRKLLLWLPGVLAAVLICSLCAVMPMGSPIMNIPYMCFISGYGLVMLLAWRKGWLPGVTGKLPRCSLKPHSDRRGIISAVIAACAVLALVWLVCRMTMYRLVPANWRLFWLAAASCLMLPGFLVSGV